MMIAIKYSEYNNFGCPNCGCADCYAYDGTSGVSTPAECPECGFRFMVVSSKLKMSAIGYNAEGIQKGFLRFNNDKADALIEKYYNESLKAVVTDDGFIFPLTVQHPRMGIPKHFVASILEEKPQTK